MVAQCPTETTCSCSSRARASLLTLISHVTSWYGLTGSLPAPINGAQPEGAWRARYMVAKDHTVRVDHACFVCISHISVHTPQLRAAFLENRIDPAPVGVVSLFQGVLAQVRRGNTVELSP